MESRIRIVGKVQFVVIAVFVFWSAGHLTWAQGEGQDREIIIVLDCSKSMEDVDVQYLTFDFIKGLSAALPRDCRIGVVAFNNDICASLPIGSSYAAIQDALNDITYKQYGNAGSGLDAAVGMFQNGQSAKKIILISDGEIMMNTKAGTEESAGLFDHAVTLAKDQDIAIDVLALGGRMEEGYTVYSAAEHTGGMLYEVTDAEELNSFINQYLFEEWGMNGSHIGKLNGTSGELSVTLPDCMMETAKIMLLGKQQNENLTVNCKADKINVLKGRKYTVVELFHPASENVTIQTASEAAMDIDAYLMTEYDYSISAGHTYYPETQTAQIWLEMKNSDGNNLLEGHLGNEGMELYLDGEKQGYTLTDGRACMEKAYEQDSMAKLNVAFHDSYGNYYGISNVEEEIIVPQIEEPEQVDWFFWSVIIIFVAAIAAIFYISSKKKDSANGRRRVIDESGTLPRERGIRGNEFCGKILIYVIRNKEDIDYPPESINLFARCNRELITLEWILDTCNLPLNLRGADKIIIKPGADKSLVIKNNSKASVLIGRGLLTKGRSGHVYYHEKVTFIFDQEDTEIEVHYKDLKPNER